MSEGDTGLCRGLLEGVKVHHHHVDRQNTVRRHCRLVLRVAADIKQPAVHARMQRLHAPVKHFGESCQFADVFHRKTRFAKSLRGSARRNQLYAESCQALRKLHQPGLVGDAQQRPANRLLACAACNCFRTHYVSPILQPELCNLSLVILSESAESGRAEEPASSRR
jgi:hypothetical protein